MRTVLSRIARGFVAACLLPAAAQAANELLDPTFGSGGFAVFDSGTGQPGIDHGVAVCPGPNDTQVVVGMQPYGASATVLRVTRNGLRDAAFGNSGMVSAPLTDAAGTPIQARSLCLGNGRVEIAYTTPELKLVVMRIGSDGLRETAGFGSNGRAIFDPGAFPGSASGNFRLHGMDRGPGGEILLSGQTGEAVTLVRVTSAGTLRDARLLADAQLPQGGYAAAAAYAPDGTLWLAGVAKVDFGFPWFRATLDGTTLAGGVTQRAPDVNLQYDFGGGRMVRPGVMAIGLHARSGSGAWVPRLLVLRAGTDTHEMLLPDAPGFDHWSYDDLNIVGMDGGNQVLFAGSLYGALYFSRIAIGADAAADAVDTTFGSHGYSVAYFRGDASCTGTRPLQAYGRISLWGDQPVFVGTAEPDCVIGQQDDILVGRLVAAGDTVFRNGFEP